MIIDVEKSFDKIKPSFMRKKKTKKTNLKTENTQWPRNRRELLGKCTANIILNGEGAECFSFKKKMPYSHHFHLTLHWIF